MFEFLLAKKKIERGKILIVDDELNIVQTVRDRLEINNYKVVAACNGKDGLEKALTEKPDVILLDVIMPVMNGHDMLERLRKTDSGKNISVVMLTARSTSQDNGHWFISDTRFGPMVHAQLGIAEENSGKLVTLIRREAKRIAQEQNKDLLIIDGSPGIGCPVIASITGSDVVLVVTEPTLSGKHDLERVAQLTANFGIKTLVCINKADINPEMSASIADDAGKHGLKVVGKIPYDEAFTKAQIMKATLIEYTGGDIAEKIKAMWREVIYELG